MADQTVVSCSVLARCHSHSPAAALHLKLAAIASIFAACVVGVTLPILGPRLRLFSVKSKTFCILKAFSAGVILGTGFVHMLPDAFAALASSCLPEEPWHRFPVAGVTAMVAALGTLLLDVAGTAIYEGRQPKEGILASSDNVITGKCDVVALDITAELEMGHAASSPPLRFKGEALDQSVCAARQVQEQQHQSMQLRYTVISQVLELGMVAHSIIIGISLGTSHSPCTIRPLVAALTFHQLFEGLALGGCIAQAAFKNGSMLVMAFVFSITTPTGIAIGIAISSVYDENSPKALIMEGLFDSMSAGILVYMALVDLIATDFLSKEAQQNLQLQLASYASLFCGAATMALVAMWA